jgi:tRNA nucleotidyltransferase (CCA-adding enzyme)
LLGIAEGPLYKEILDKIRLLKIDGKLKTKEEELLYAKNNYL